MEAAHGAAGGSIQNAINWPVIEPAHGQSSLQAGGKVWCVGGWTEGFDLNHLTFVDDVLAGHCSEGRRAGHGAVGIALFWSCDFLNGHRFDNGGGDIICKALA